MNILPVDYTMTIYIGLWLMESMHIVAYKTMSFCNLIDDYTMKEIHSITTESHI